MSSPVFVLYKLLHQEISFGCREVTVKKYTTKLDARAELLLSLLNLIFDVLIASWLLKFPDN